mmetsp:Transcript_11524/g.16556  ORF Transcript_11524/g.16556 Transcript_11524/m.16556 type:complete len:204 (-) Transcript_11524:333-944(-)
MFLHKVVHTSVQIVRCRYSVGITGRACWGNRVKNMGGRYSRGRHITRGRNGIRDTGQRNTADTGSERSTAVSGWGKNSKRLTARRKNGRRNWVTARVLGGFLAAPIGSHSGPGLLKEGVKGNGSRSRSNKNSSGSRGRNWWYWPAPNELQDLNIIIVVDVRHRNICNSTDRWAEKSTIFVRKSAILNKQWIVIRVEKAGKAEL